MERDIDKPEANQEPFARLSPLMKKVEKFNSK